MFAVLLPPGVNPIAVKYMYHIISSQPEMLYAVHITLLYVALIIHYTALDLITAMMFGMK
jgi:hypothetical protein